MSGPVHLAVTPDGKGVMVASSFRSMNHHGFAMFVSTEDNLAHWRSVMLPPQQTLDFVNVEDAVTDSGTALIRVAVRGADDGDGDGDDGHTLLTVQRIRSLPALLAPESYTALLRASRVHRRTVGAHPVQM